MPKRYKNKHRLKLWFSQEGTWEVDGRNGGTDDVTLWAMYYLATERGKPRENMTEGLKVVRARIQELLDAVAVYEDELKAERE